MLTPLNIVSMNQGKGLEPGSGEHPHDVEAGAGHAPSSSRLAVLEAVLRAVLSTIRDGVAGVAVDARARSCQGWPPSS